MEFEHVSGMESINAEFDNTYNLAAGFESIVAAGPSGTVDGFEATYAMTVFNLNDIDFSGQEGFLDSVKRGARKVYEWIKDLIKTIRGWFTGSSKAKYEEAKKEIDGADIALINQVKRLKEKGIDAYIDYDKDNSEYRIIKKISTKDKEIINDEIRKVEIADVASPQELAQKIIGTVVNDIGNMVSSRLSQLNKRVEEIRRIDPTGETLESLGLDGKWNFITDAARNKEAAFSREDQAQFARRVKSLTEAADVAQEELAKATVALDRMNEAAKGHDEQSHKLSRAVAVVRILTEIATIWRDTIISINSQTQKASKNMADGIVKEALRKAKESTDESTNQYIDQMMKSI